MSPDDPARQRTAPFRAFLHGFLLPFRGARFLLSHRGVKRYAMLPLLANALLYLLVIGLALYLIHEWKWAGADWEFWGPVGGWLGAAVNAVARASKWLLLLPILFVVCYFTFTAVGMIVASPFLDLLAERVEWSLTGRGEPPGMGWGRQIKVTVLSILDALWIVLQQVVFTLLVLPLLLVPVVGVLPLFLVTAYYTGIGFVDPNMARNFLRHKHKKPAFRARAWEILGLGTAMEILFMVPLAGLILLPVGVTAGTLLYCDMDWERLLRDANLPLPEDFRPPVRIR